MPVHGILFKYERKRAIRKISKDVEKNIISELGKEKNLIEDENIPISFYNYSYIKDRIYQAYRQKVSLPTIITQQRGKRSIKMNEHILVIDDDIGIRESLFLVLDDAGYQVDTTESGEQGIRKAIRLSQCPILEQEGSFLYRIILGERSPKVVCSGNSKNNWLPRG